MKTNPLKRMYWKIDYRHYPMLFLTNCRYRCPAKPRWGNYYKRGMFRRMINVATATDPQLPF